MDERYEKTVKSPNEKGEYLLSQDCLDLADGKEKTVYAVYFRKDGIEEWEYVTAFETAEEAEEFANTEVELSKILA